MGDIADMMLEGTLCEGCGVFLDGSQPGFARLCRDCRPKTKKGVAPPANPLKVNCPTCAKRVKASGLRDHVRASHPLPSSPTP